MYDASTPAEVVEFVQSHEQVKACGGRTKNALSQAANLSLAKLTGIEQYDPAEYTVTVRAGTRVAELSQVLEEHQQYLPFDPPLAKAGATLGGTVAAGLSGPGRYRFGGVKDFILGGKLVTGAGELVTIGSKVVKNSAGFDLPKLMVGSLGCLGIMTELTFKVFPRPANFATLVFESRDLHQAIALVTSLARSQFDLASLEVDAEFRVWTRICGLERAVSRRADRILASIEVTGFRLPDEQEQAWWEGQSEFQWLPAGYGLAKIVTTLDRLEDLMLHLKGTIWRIGVAGNVVWIGWPSNRETAQLEQILADTGLSGVSLLNMNHAVYPRGFERNLFLARLSQALDPLRKFAWNEPPLSDADPISETA